MFVFWKVSKKHLVIRMLGAVRGSIAFASNATFRDIRVTLVPNHQWVFQNKHQDGETLIHLTLSGSISEQP